MLFRRALMLMSLFAPAALAQDAPDVAPATAPATSPATQSVSEDSPEKMMADFKQEFGGLPRKPDTTIDKILSIKLEEGFLHVEPKLPMTDGAVAINATDWPGFLSVVVGDPKFLAFSLKHVDASQLLKKNRLQITMVSTAVDYLQINRDSEDDSGVVSATLIQAEQFANDAGDPVRLTVQRVWNQDLPGRENTTDVYEAKTFEELRRAHAPELRKYLFPILKDLGAAAMMRTADLRSAWQVLGNDITPDPKLEKTLDAVIVKLGADDFTVRAAAQDELAALGPAAAAALAKRDLKDVAVDPKVSIESFVSSTRTLRADRVEAMQKDANFLLDAMLLDDPALRRAAQSRLEKMTSKKIDLPDTLKPADREARIEKLRTELAPTTQPATPPGNG
jgi:hypothetical protein